MASENKIGAGMFGIQSDDLFQAWEGRDVPVKLGGFSRLFPGLRDGWRRVGRCLQHGKFAGHFF